ncbi:MAG: hypothetical protein ACK5Q7_08065 [Cyanobacteriota bacterium]
MAHADLTAAELFHAAVSYSRRRGKLKTESDADPGKSRSTGQTFVLAAADDRVIDRIPLEKLYRDAEKMQDTYLPEVTKGWNDLPLAGKVALICVFSALLLNFCRSGGIQTSPPSDWLTDGSAWASCEVALQNQLRDPDSYQQVGEPVAIPTKEEGKAAWTWRFRSRNGLGGMNAAIAGCVANRAGQTVSAQIMVQ